MSNKENENLINDILNSQKPDKNVLSSAKSLIEKNKPIRLRIKKQFYAILSSAAVFIIVGVVFAVLNQINNKNYEDTFNSIGNDRFDYGFLIVAISLISIGILLAISAIVIRVKKINKLID